MLPPLAVGPLSGLRLRPRLGGWLLCSALRAFGLVGGDATLCLQEAQSCFTSFSPSPASRGGGDPHAYCLRIAPTQMKLRFRVDFATATGVKSTRNHFGHRRFTFWVDFATAIGVKSTRNPGWCWRRRFIATDLVPVVSHSLYMSSFTGTLSPGSFIGALYPFEGILCLKTVL